MGKAFRTLILALPAMLAVASCTENLPEVSPESGKTDAVYLKIGSVTTSELTKSVIEGTKFPTADAASIGLFIDGEDYTGATYTNVKYTKPAGSDNWTDPQIALQTSEATVYGYYPYSSGVTSIGSIPVSSSIDGADWMWATPVEGVSASKPEVSLSMNHALALVEVTFNVTCYVEGAEMTALTLTSGSFAAAGTLDATDGTITANGVATGGCQLLAEGQTLTIKDGVVVAKCLLVPTGLDGRQDMTIACTLDGKNLKATLTEDKGVVVKSGTKSTVSLNVKGTTMEVTEVGVSGWNSNITSTSTATVDGHSVTVSSAVPISLSLTGVSSLSGRDRETVSESLVISFDKSILADGKYCVDYTCDKAGACTITPNTTAGTITVSKVTDDVTITLSKNVNWYDVTLTTEGNGTAYIGTQGTTSAQCNPDSSVTLTAVPDEAEEFIGWQDAEGNSLSKDNPLTCTPAADVSIKAVFTTRVLSGVFTVGTDGSGNAKKARFSCGNLWYDGSDFFFESEQYLSSPASNGDRVSNHISHFMWNATASDALALQYNNDRAEVFFASDGLDVYGSTAWQVLSYNGYLSLLCNRDASTVCGTENARWFNGQINTGSSTVNGLFLIPDVFTWPESVTVTPNNINSWTSYYSGTPFTLDQFHVLEEAGIVFLPAAGSRPGSDGSAEVKSVNTTGSYWSSDYNAMESAEYISFNNTRLIASENSAAHSNTYRYMAQSVRLLIDVTE